MKSPYADSFKFATAFEAKIRRLNQETNMNHKTCAVIGLLVATTTLVGCASIASIERMQLTVKDYAAAAPRVNLGMTKGQVGEILQPTQHSGTRYPEMYTKDGAVVEILYFR